MEGAEKQLQIIAISFLEGLSSLASKPEFVRCADPGCAKRKSDMYALACNLCAKPPAYLLAAQSNLPVRTAKNIWVCPKHEIAHKRHHKEAGDYDRPLAG